MCALPKNFTKDGLPLAEPDIFEISRLVQQGIQSGLYSGAQVVASFQGQLIHRRCYGRLSVDRKAAAVEQLTLFDLGSLTQSLATSLAIMKLWSQQRLLLDATLSSVLKQLRHCALGEVTLDMLLDHSSGLPATLALWQKIQEEDRHLPKSQQLFSTTKSKDKILAYLKESKLLAAPGSISCASELGFILLGFVVEAITEQSLDQFVEQHLYEPLKLSAHIAYRPLDDLPPSSSSVFSMGQFSHEAIASHLKQKHLVADKYCVATQQCPVRKRLMQGEVDDLLAYSLGGVAGHSGLFAHATAVWQLAQTLLDAYHGRSSFFHTGSLQRFWRRSQRTPQSSYTLGFETPHSHLSAVGGRFSKQSVGHVGVVGTAFWIDPVKQCIGIFLTNQAHPKAEGKKEAMAQKCKRLFDLIAAYSKTSALLLLLLDVMKGFF